MEAVQEAMEDRREQQPAALIIANPL